MSIRNNLHTDHGLETYAQGMCNSAGDKARINHHLVAGTILELGCGNGAYLQTLPNDRLAQTTAVDMNAMLLQKARENLREPGAAVRFIRDNLLSQSFFYGLTRYSGGSRFDNVVLSSVLHELYSEAFHKEMQTVDENGAHQKALDVVSVFMRNVWDMVAPGGVLIVRDGIKHGTTGTPSDYVHIRFNKLETRLLFARFVDEYPWFVDYHEHKDEVIVHKSFAYEFATKYFYTENWDIEVLERFGCFTPKEVFNMVSGGKKLVSTSYLIPWLGSKWSEDFEIYSDGKLQYPDSTMLVVIQKTG